MKPRAAHEHTPQTGLALYLRNPHKSSLRKFAFALHKWGGAVVALYLLLMSATGVSLVFHDELSDIMCPPRHVNVGQKRADFEKIVSNFQKDHTSYKVTGIICPTAGDLPLDVFASSEDSKKLAVEVDPYTAEILGPKKENEVLKTLRDLHFNLLNGKTGRTINGIGAILLFLLCVTGVVVWWRGLRDWFNGFKLALNGNFRRVNWSIHSALGIWALPFLLVWSVSGFYFGFTTFFEKSLNVVFPVSAQKQLASPDDKIELEENQAGSMAIAALHSIPPSIDKLVNAAKSAAPREDHVERIAFPDKKRSSVRVWLSNTKLADSPSKTQVFLNPVSGEVIAVSASNALPAGDIILQWLTKLHFGNFLGVISKSIWLLIGMTPGILALTGLVLFTHGWISKRLKHL